MFFRCVVYLSVTALSHTKVVLSYGLLRIYRSFGPWYVFLYIGAQNPTGYPPTKGSGFWSQGNNKYQMMPKTASRPKPHPDIRVISGRVLGPGHYCYYYYTLSSQRLFIREKLLLGRDLEFMYSPYNSIVSGPSKMTYVYNGIRVK